MTIDTLGIKFNPKVDLAVIHETLTRIGIVNNKEKIIYPSCYIHEETDELGVVNTYICHFKQMFAFEGKPSTFNKTDKLRLKTISYFLQRWNLIEIVNLDDIDTIMQDKIQIVKATTVQTEGYKITHKYRPQKQAKA